MVWESDPQTRDSLGHAICDYSHTDYRDFWEHGARKYEDVVERIALRRLCDSVGGRCVEIGAGYGRLVNEYAPRCDAVLLTDFAESLLDQASERVRQLGYSHVECRVANLYELERLGERFDQAICVRVLHHVEDVPAFFTQVNRVLMPGGTFVLEFANKRNFKEIARWLARRPNLAPFDRNPSARKGEVYYNFHPAYVQSELFAAGFLIERMLAVSWFRSRTLKRLVPSRALAAIEKPLQRVRPAFTPSVFVRARKLEER